jgi:hypothetical protein
VRVAILLHERQRGIVRRGYRIWALARALEQRGIRVDLAWGPRARIEADLLIPHIDLTVMPPEYARVLDEHPRVVNRRVRDVSKRRISRNLVREGDGYEGPVIVKTDRNHGGLPEADARSRLLGALARAGALLRPLGRATHVLPRRYPVFPSVKDLPPGVFGNPNLVVERFLPEREGDRCFVRYYSFFGDRAVCLRRGGKGPVVRFDASAAEEVPVPDAIVAERERLGFDYGKFDFVVHEGTPVLLDANPTPALPRATDADSARRLASLADGIRAFL